MPSWHVISTHQGQEHGECNCWSSAPGLPLTRGRAAQEEAVRQGHREVRSVPDHVATISRLLQYLLRHSFKSSSETSKKKKKMTRLKHNRSPLQNILHLHHLVRLRQTKAISMPWDPQPGAETQDIPNTVIKEVSEQHGELPLLVYGCWNPVLEEHTRGLCAPPPSLTFQIHGCHHDPVAGRTQITVLSHQCVCEPRRSSSPNEDAPG